MLNNRIVFARLIALLNSIDENYQIDEELQTLLWEEMEPEDYCKVATCFEPEGETPKKAYYVVTGFVIVYGFNHQLDRYVLRIYRKNTIVAMHCFMAQEDSEYCIWACAGTLLWSITADVMDKIYEWIIRSKVYHEYGESIPPVVHMNLSKLINFTSS